jgi:peptidoglycan/xylan/chitin deacetylase (PgdA/CDA1 family)
VTRRLAILGYHNVEASPSSTFAPEEGVRGFVAQVERLRQVANVVPLSSALSSLFSGGTLPPRAVSITFDDGYRDHLDVVAPILHSVGMPATFFLVPGLVSRECVAWWEYLGWGLSHARSRSVRWHDRTVPLVSVRAHRAFRNSVSRELRSLSRSDRDARLEELIHRLAPAGSPPSGSLFLDWDESRELVRRGFEVGSHSSAHAILSREHPADQSEDLSISKKVLEEQLEVPIDLLAYPNGAKGDYTTDTIEAARDAGYKYALTTRHGRNGATSNPFELRRVVVDPRRGAPGLLRMLAQLWAAPARDPQS